MKRFKSSSLSPLQNDNFRKILLSITTFPVNELLHLISIDQLEAIRRRLDNSFKLREHARHASLDKLESMKQKRVHELETIESEIVKNDAWFIAAKKGEEVLTYDSYELHIGTAKFLYSEKRTLIDDLLPDANKQIKHVTSMIKEAEDHEPSLQRKQLERMLKSFDEERKIEQLRKKLTEIAKLPILKQLSLFQTFEILREIFTRHNINNNNLSAFILQINNLMSLRTFLSNEVYRVNRSYLYENLTVSVLSEQKLQQLELRLATTKGDKWEKKNVWFYTATEWVIEDWAIKNKLQYFDYNETNQFAHQDCQINGTDVDIKTTLGIGKRHMPIYYSTRNKDNDNEIIVGISSKSETLESIDSTHLIQGIFDPNIYKKLKTPLKFFTPHKNLINPCYFSSLEYYFNLTPKHNSQTISYSKEFVTYCIKSKQYLKALINTSLHTLKHIKFISEQVLHEHHLDFIPIIEELAEKKLIHLLPHYLADYLIAKIINKAPIDNDSITNTLYLFHTPSPDQKKYIENLLLAKESLLTLRCNFHPEESIKEMDVEFYCGNNGQPILRARCSKDPQLKTTFFTYSWRSGETLIYNNDDIKLCDAPRCGCLTHVYWNERIGRSTCEKYGRNGTHRYIENNNNNNNNNHIAQNLSEEDTEHMLLQLYEEIANEE